MTDTDTPKYCLVWGNKVTGFAGHGSPSEDYDKLMKMAQTMNEVFSDQMHDVVRDWAAEDWVADFPRTASEVFPEYRGDS
jgi:hypothetical protein